MKISDVVKGKASQDVVTVSPEASVRQLVEVLDEFGIGAVVVSTDGETVHGIVSERDVVRRLHLDGAAVLDHAVSTIMTAEVHTCSLEDNVQDLAGEMTRGRFRHAPVVVDGRLAGIVSIGDVVKRRIDELEFERDQLDNYVRQS
ncbi:MAG: CBS domain-containing protein [Nocardioides sp.]|uniref:CBS domain-containing protein n=1 Tax=Nocardioides sp. TaxID=35761 RepID=UPI003F009A29